MKVLRGLSGCQQGFTGWKIWCRNQTLAGVSDESLVDVNDVSQLVSKCPNVENGSLFQENDVVIAVTTRTHFGVSKGLKLVF